MPFIGEIRMFAGNFAPAGWAFCDGQFLLVSQNATLFNLIGTTYGGNGQLTFALPDLRGRVPIHFSAGFDLGERDGVESVTLTTLQTPVHTHALLATANTATSSAPGGQVLAASTGATVTPYGTDAPLGQLSAQMIGGVGGTQPHTNLQPFLCIRFIIALFGNTPSPG
jgi:microcystin-dependent protein